MPGRPPEVTHVKNTFLDEISAARNLVVAINAIPAKVSPSASIGLHPKYAQRVVALAFMAVVAAWEEFLECSLVRYLAGAKTASGYKPRPKLGMANNIPHAYKVLSQDANYESTKNYLKVNDPRWVRITADFFFDTHHYNCLQAKTDLLEHASRIRNRVAHGSNKCRNEFKKTAIYFMRPANNSLPYGYGPGKLLIDPVQRHFGHTGLTHFDAYLTMYEQLANTIVPP